MKTIILAGGSGTRLWPISRESYPKQFIKLNENRESLFQETFMRSLLLSHISDIYIITNEKYKFMAIDAIEELGYSAKDCNIIVEPEAKNTLPAIYAGVHEIVKKEHDIVVVFPSDHVITRSAEFLEIIRTSINLAKNNLITFGIKPDSPNTGYGYISPGDSIYNGFSVQSFKEKPSYDNAVKYIEKGYLWNAGIFMFNTELFSNEVSKYTPDIHRAFNKTDNIKDAFSLIENKLSIDYGIMEKSGIVAVVPVSIGWNDLGSFDAFYDVFSSDENSNITGNHNILLDSNNLLVQSNSRKIITAIGVEDLIVIDEEDALLICKKNSSQSVKKLVSILKEKKDKRIEIGSKSFHEWGGMDTLVSNNNNFLINKISINREKTFNYFVKEGIEHWVIVSGSINLIARNVAKIISEGESCILVSGDEYIIENKGENKVEIIRIDLNI